MDKDFRETLRRSPVWRQKDGLLCSFPGVGEQVSVSVLAYLPELGTLDRKQVATLVGAGSINRDSGIMRGGRTVWGGRSRVEAALYTGTLAATRYNVAIRAFYQRLFAAGKAGKVARVAGMRRLLSILNSMVMSGRHGALKRLHLDSQDGCFGGPHVHVSSSNHTSRWGLASNTDVPLFSIHSNLTSLLPSTGQTQSRIR